MTRLKLTCGLVVLALSLLGCGETIGAACTTKSDCGNGLCLNTSAFPGGYCSAQCVASNATSCPSDSTCVENGVSDGINGCFKLCKTPTECREGYSCVANYKGNAHGICIAAQ